MKIINKLLTLLMLCTLILSGLISVTPVSASGPISIYATPATVTSTGTYVNVNVTVNSTIDYSGTFNIYMTGYDVGIITYLSCNPAVTAGCDGVSHNQFVNLTAGVPYTFTINVRADAGASYGSITNAGGSYGNADIGYYELNNTVFINYTAPAPTPTPSPTVPTVPAAPTVNEPEIPVEEDIIEMLSNEQVLSQYSYSVSSTLNDDGTRSNIIRGNGAVDQKIKVILHSEPQVYDTTVSAEGEWEIELTKELDAGDHEIFVQVLNSDGEAISEEVKLGGLYMSPEGVLALNKDEIKADESALVEDGSDTDDKGESRGLIAILAVCGITGVVLVAAGAYYLYKRGKTKKTDSTTL